MKISERDKDWFVDYILSQGFAHKPTSNPIKLAKRYVKTLKYLNRVTKKTISKKARK